MVWIESPTNPLMMVMDIPRLASLIREFNKDIILVVDNTFVTSYFQVPNLIKLKIQRYFKISKIMLFRHFYVS